MNEYKIKVNLERGLIINPDIHLVQNDYNSTTFNFEFDDYSYEQYTKVFQLQYPDGLIWKKEIKDNKVTLVNFDEEGNPVSILVQTGKYYFDIAVYDNDSKLTTTEKVYFNVREEITGEDIELDDRLPVLDDLINTVNRNLNETDNLDIELKDNILTITKKDGTTYSENVKGEPGQQGKPGAVKIIPVTELPIENIEEDAIYLKPNPNPTSEKDKYQEFVYVNDDWELWGGGTVSVDLADYVKKEYVDTNFVKPTDYASGSKAGVVKVSHGNSNAPLYRDNSGNILLGSPTNSEIDRRTVKKAILCSNLEYAVGSVKATETQSGSAKMWTSTNEDGEIGLNISTEV